MPTPNLFWRSLTLVTFSLLTSHLSLLKSQCPTVDAGPDQTACAPSGTVTLQGSVSGNILGFNWDPTTGMGNPNSLTPTVNVTGTLTYTLTAAAFDPAAPNLVTNPAFEMGNTGFTSDFTYTSAPVTPGTYFIATSPTIVNSNFPPCDDHTFGNGTGNMLLLNGTGNAGAQVWCQTIPVTPNTWYSMSAWATTTPISPPLLQFSVNGQLLGSPFPVGTAPCSWQQFSEGWFSGPATSVDFCITDQNGGGNGLFGDDFALDDIYFAEACSVSDDVTVSLADVHAILDPFIELPCNALPAGIILDGSGSSTGPNITYSWAFSPPPGGAGGGIVSGANTATPTINLEGTYTLTVTFDDGTAVCTDQASIQVLPDPNIVFAIIAPADELNCDNPTVTLNGGASSSGPTITYDWVFTPPPGGAGGGIVSGGDTPFPIVDMGGTYTLTLTNSISGCTDMASVFVFENFIEPTAIATAPEELTCADTLSTLSGTGSSTGNEYTYLWTYTPPPGGAGGGGIVSGETTLNNCVVDSAGTYTLTVTNTQNGCTADTFAIVVADVAPPNAVASAPTPIGCGGGPVGLSGSGSSTGNSFDYLWTTVNGNILNGETSLSPTVDVSAEYLLTVSNSDNGCSAGDTTFLSENTASMTVDIALPDTLDCLLTEFQLDATASTQNPDISISWTFPPPSGGQGGATLMPTVDAPGTYTLTLTDNPTGCTAEGSVTVFENTAPPTAEAGPAATIDCGAEPVSLNGSGSAGPQFTYLWTYTPPVGGGGGGLLSGETSLSPEVNAAGTYFFTVTDGTNGCTATDSTEVNQVGDAPVVSLVVNDVLDCQTDTLTIDGSGSTSGPQILIEWTSPPSGGTGGATLTPAVDAAGIYTLTLTDQTSGCVGTGSVTVEIDTVAPVAGIAPAAGFDCLLTTDTLDATASSQGVNFVFNWVSFGGQILSGGSTLEPAIEGAGDYVLTVLNVENSCLASDTITVTEDTTPPTVEAGDAQTLTCDVTTLILNGNGGGSQIEYLWTSPDGNLASGQNTPMPTVDAPGNYILTVTDLGNGCTASDSVAVAQSADLPTAVIAPADTLTCAFPTVVLDGTGSSSGSQFVYAWTYPPPSGGTGGATLMPTVDAPGTYLLTVTDTSNLCASTAEVTVVQNSDLPTAEAGTPFTLSCSMPEVVLNGAGSVGPQIEYLWTYTPPVGGGGGGLLSGEMTLSPTINAAGTYLLTVTDASNGCTATDEVTIGQDAAAPVADAGEADTLTCLTTSLFLDGNGSSSGPQITYLWTYTPPSGGAGGGIVAGQTTLMPEVDAPGTYLLTVTDGSNLCQSFSSVTIAEVSEGPEIMVADSAFLNCADTVFTINATVDGQPNLLWTYTPPTGGAGGGIISGETTLSPTIGAAGTYLLTATDGASGCTSTATVTAFEDMEAPVVSVIAPPVLPCGQTEVELMATVDAGGGWDGVWTAISGTVVSGIGTLDPVVGVPGEYLFFVTDLTNGCTASASASVSGGGLVPTAVIAPPGGLNCLDTLVVLDGSGSSAGPGFSMTWGTPDGHFAGGQNTLMPGVDGPGTYILIIENTANGCADTASVSVAETITEPGADAGPDALLTCDEPEIALDGGSPTLGVDFAWTSPDGHFLFGANSQMPGVDAVGTYFLTITDPVSGCSSMDSMVVTDVFLHGFGFEKTDADCVSATGDIVFGEVDGGLGWLEFSIDGGAVFASQTAYGNLPPGTYDLVVRDSGGCEIGDVAIIGEAAGVELSLPQIVSLDLGESHQLNPILNLPDGEITVAEWSPTEGLSCADCLRPVATPLADATYLLTVTSADGCTASAAVSFVVASPNGGVYVPNAFSPNGDGINDKLVVFGNPDVVADVKRFLVFTRWGESVFEGYDFPPNDFDFGWDGTHRGEDLGTGVYAWFAEVVLVNGEERFLEGEVVLMK